jgi:hypothetical protein
LRILQPLLFGKLFHVFVSLRLEKDCSLYALFYEIYNKFNFKKKKVMKKNYYLIAIFSLLVSFQVNAQPIGTLFVSDFDAPLLSGVYQTNLPQLNYPNLHEWKHLFVIRNTNPDNSYQFQLSSNYGEDDRVFFRKIVQDPLGNRNSTWHEFATKGSNTFIGEQYITDGTLYLKNSSEIFHEYKSQIYFGYPTENSDNIFIARFNIEPDKSELRVNVGDDNNDKFVIGRKFWNEMEFTPMFTVVTNGNVGIGVSDPANKLEVNGTIRASEITVETGWADHVFSKDYNLPTLKEVKFHIDANKHLPGIPTETEVKEKGVNLGEMQVKLLQKIEELTLYIIQQDEKIQEMRSKLEKIENLQK